MKKIVPFIVSVPSWVIPGTYAENLRFLESRKEVRGVELLFFIYDDEVKKQLELEWEEISSYSERFVFTAHLPEVLGPAHGELIARLAPVVRHFIVHPAKENPAAQAVLLGDWARQYNAFFLAENTNPGMLEPLLAYLDFGAESNMGLCIDTGHLLLEGKNPARYFQKHREHIKEIHLHAVDSKSAAIDGRLKDHRRLLAGEKWLGELRPLLADFNGVVNLEVFSWEEASESIDVLLNNF